ncbi:MAG: family 43 glycosylhydrolase, partial [bacterium]
MKRTTTLSLATIFLAALLSCNTRDSETPEDVSGTEAESSLVPGEQAPLADPGQNTFGGIRQVGTTKSKSRPGRPSFPEPEIATVHFDSISMSDPFVFPDEKTKTYYLTGTGGRLYRSKDLRMWTGPYKIIDLEGTWMDSLWVAAAEIHQFGDKYYLAGTWSDHTTLIEAVPRRYNVPRNQTQLLVSDNIEGPYKPLVMDYDFCLGPEDWDIIDGTLYEEDGTVYLVFVHEWTQIIDGTMDYFPLSKD